MGWGACLLPRVRWLLELNRGDAAHHGTPDIIRIPAHINKMGGTKSPLQIAEVKELWSWFLAPKVDFSQSTALAGSHGRLSAETLEGQDRLDAISQHLQMSGQSVCSDPSK